MGRPRLDLAGKRFGKLIALRDVTERPGSRKWLCECDCGSTTIANAGDLNQGKTQSCGCGQGGVTHGLTRIRGSKRRLYAVWVGIRQRCENAGSREYPQYGGRGITVSDEWHEYEPFHQWAHSNGYRPGLTLDRIDNDGPYAPENCRWVPMSTQARNKRTTKRVTFRGETKSLAGWAEALGMHYETLRGRLRRGWNVERAFTTPARGAEDASHA